MRPGWIRPSAMSFVSDRRATSRRTGSKPDSTTVSGVSSMIRSTPVACSSARMLRPSRPMIRPFISSLGRWTTVTACSAVWSAATRCIAVTMTSRAFSWASSRARRSIARASLTASCSASSRMASSSTPFASSRRQPGDALERDDLLLGQPGELLALRLEVALAVADLAALLLEHVGALVQLLVARQQAPLEVLELGPLARAPRPRPRAPGAASRPSPRGSCPSAGSAPRRRSARPCPGRTSRSGLTTCRGRRIPRQRRRRRRPRPRRRRSSSIFGSSHPAEGCRRRRWRIRFGLRRTGVRLGSGPGRR